MNLSYFCGLIVYKERNKDMSEQKTVLSCIQPTGNIHLGNYFGAVQNWINLQEKYKCCFGVVDYHAMTMPYNVKKLRESTWELTLNLVSVGIKPENLFIQSLIPEHTELCWIFDTLVTMPYLMRAHAYKDAEAKNKEIGVGTFNYPVLMAADILLYDAHLVPVGKDQLQHLEMTRDVASRINHNCGEELLVLPEAKIQSDTQLILGTDGAKMSKSANNFINKGVTNGAINVVIEVIVMDSARLAFAK